MKFNQTKGDIDEYGEETRQWKLDKIEKILKRKRIKGHYYGNRIRSLFEDCIDQKELSRRDSNKHSGIDFGEAFGNLSGR